MSKSTRIHSMVLISVLLFTFCFVASAFVYDADARSREAAVLSVKANLSTKPLQEPPQAHGTTRLRAARGEIPVSCEDLGEVSLEVFSAACFLEAQVTRRAAAEVV